MSCHVVDFQVHFCSLLGTSTLSFLILIRHILRYIKKKLFARLHNKYEFLIITLALTIFCFLIGSYLIHFKFFYPFLFLPSRGHTVPPFHRSKRFHRSTIPPDRYTCYLQVPRISDFHVEQSSTITSRCNQKHYTSSRTLLVNVLNN